MADYYFPRDVLIEIFLRLPAKTLVVYSRLCKLWRDIITDPLFITKYSSKSNRYQGKNKFIFLQNYPNKEHSQSIEYVDWPYENICNFIDISSQRKSNPQNIVELMKLLFSTQISSYEVHGYCKGLILLSTVQFRRSKMLFIINPSLGVFFPLITFEKDQYKYRVCIGFDSISNDYKVLVFDDESSPTVRLYSLNTDSWKDISVNAQYPHTVNVSGENPVFINGYVHWKAYKKTEDSSSLIYLILRFDVTREVFDIMCFPMASMFDSEYWSLSLAIVFGKFGIGTHSDLNGYSIWVMNEYDVKESWTEQYRVKESIGNTVLGSHLDGELLFSFSWLDMELISSYDPKSGERTHLRCPSGNASWKTLYMENLEESLVLFDRRAPKFGVDI